MYAKNTIDIPVKNMQKKIINSYKKSIFLQVEVET